MPDYVMISGNRKIKTSSPIMSANTKARHDDAPASLEDPQTTKQNVLCCVFCRPAAMKLPKVNGRGCDEEGPKFRPEPSSSRNFPQPREREHHINKDLHLKRSNNKVSLIILILLFAWTMAESHHHPPQSSGKRWC